MDNSAYQQQNYFNTSDNTMFNQDVIGNSNWQNQYVPNSMNVIDKGNYYSNFSNTFTENLPKGNYFDSNYYNKNISNHDNYNNNLNQSHPDYSQLIQRKNRNDYEPPTDEASAASWGIMFPVQLTNPSKVSKSPWTFDNSCDKIDNRQNCQNNVENNEYSNYPLDRIERSIRNMSLSDNNRFVNGFNYNSNNGFVSPSKKPSWALVVGKTGKQNQNFNHIPKNLTISSAINSSKVDVLKSQQQSVSKILFNQSISQNFDCSPKNAKFFVIKSYSEDDVYRSIKYQIWCSTETGNRRLDNAYSQSCIGLDENQSMIPIYLFFSVNGSGHFCGVAQMMSPVDYKTRAGVWAQGKWKGQFHVRWIFVKDVPNSQLRHIRIETNDNKPVTNSRDVTEIPLEKGRQVLKIIANYRATSSIYDDFDHYEQRELSESTN